MDFLLITIGSHGDVHPFVGVGRELLSRGHTVRVLVNAHFREMVERAGLEAIDLGTKDDYARITKDPTMWHPTKGPARVMQYTIETFDPVYKASIENAGPQTTIVTSSLGVASLCAAETHQRRVVTAHLAPICVRSCERLPRLAMPFDLNRLPMFMRRKFWDGADRWFIDPPIAPAFNEFRAKLGLKPVRQIFGVYWHSTFRSVGFWPDWFAPRCSDWPAQFVTSDFPLYDEADHHELDSALEDFLRAGDAPIAFTPGSAMQHGQQFFQTAVEACGRIGRRALLLTRFGEQIPANLPAHARHIAYAPFSDLLPRVAALVHHGGIGTTAQALRAGVPQLFMPMSHDQPDNAANVTRLGCGDWVWPRSFKPRAVAKALHRLLTDAGIGRAAQAVAARFVPNACGRIVDELLKPA
jgi:rhamnosyltransferase subunit B